MPIPRGTTVSNRLGRSSDWLPFRSLPDPEGSVAEIFGTSAEFHSSGTVRDLHPIPFSFPSPHGESETKSGAKIALNTRKTSLQVGKYHPTGLPEPWRAGLTAPPEKSDLHTPRQFRIGNKLLPSISEQKYNLAIKRIFKMPRN